MGNLKKLHLLNLEKMEYISELNLTNQVMIDLQNDAIHYESFEDKVIVNDGIMMTGDTISVPVKLFMTDDAEFNPSLVYSQIWKLDTSDASSDYNIRYLTTIKHTKEDPTIYMNSKFLCDVFFSFSSSEMKLNVYHLDDLSRSYSSTVISETTTHNYKGWFSISLESGMSNRIAFFDRRRWILKVYNLDDANGHVLQVNFMNIYSKVGLIMANFFMGKIVFIKLSWGEEYSVCDFQFLFVTEVGDLIESKIQRLPTTITMFKGSSSFYIDDDGMLLYTESGWKIEDDEPSHLTNIQQLHWFHL